MRRLWVTITAATDSVLVVVCVFVAENTVAYYTSAVWLSAFTD